MAIAFFTRLPVSTSGSSHQHADRSLVDCIPFFPVTGLLIGFVSGAVWALSSLIFPSAISAGLAIAAGILVTGALHEDGLADCADGLGGTSDRSRALEIMRDSRIGTYGAIALILSVGLRWAALASLPVNAGFAALMIVHAVSRTSIVTAMVTSQYARPKGLGSMAQGEASTADIAIAYGVAAILALILGGLGGVTASVIGLGAGWLFLQYLKIRLGGYTGDGLGAIQQVSEIAILSVLAGFWS